ncbi:Stp1/IreP family PP2C-type Ser/Thr phosphatase [Salicibibacter halophilus]|uniref:protein-serine/threonine phosphatase n=1 Tax=Salicibibacter halophilus TaxID=2502791 RepID=A0A514LMA4_9BACI|nr:Stp1/IreP family PP2C-type Ser/Thr phosphatase [Salicibibacter halophilus]QDI92994.1 Stp1/IreP family PP2C-type Ser/Thr phosphatase [Salicibibacter halophilus]
METVFRTDVGNVRSHNEDAGGLFYGEDMTLAVVADGMGGHRAGDVASEMVVEALRESWQNHPPQNDIDAIKDWLEKEIKRANRAVFSKSSDEVAFKGMGTTVIASVLYNDMMVVAHVGDSRAYRLQSRTIEQVTSDHSLVNELVKKGQLSRDEAENHPRSNVLIRAIGTEEEIEVDVGAHDFSPHSVLLLCSDGLSDKLGEMDVEAKLIGVDSMAEAADALIQEALARGGEDNISVILAHHDEEGADS